MNRVDELHGIVGALLGSGVEHGVLPEGRLVLVSRDALLQMKRLAGRSQDLADLDRLEGRDPGRAPRGRPLAATSHPGRAAVLRPASPIVWRS